MSEKVNVGVNNLIERELAGAVAAGKAPQFHVQSRNSQNSEWTMGEGEEKRGEDRLSITLALLLDGKTIIHTKEQTVKQVPRGLAYEGKMGSVDIMETVLREAIVLRWPELGPELAKIRTDSYAVHAIGARRADNSEEHHVQVHFRVWVDGCREPYPISRAGVDTVKITFYALVDVYRWFVWRTLRRLRGEARKREKC